MMPEALTLASFQRHISSISTPFFLLQDHDITTQRLGDALHQ